VYRIDAGQVDKPGYLDGVCRGHRQVLEVGSLHDDVLVFRVLITLDQLVLLHEGLVVRTVLAVVNARVAGGVQGGKGHVLALGGRVELDRNRDHSEADGTFLDGSW
jgi:hypothetical protein